MRSRSVKLRQTIWLVVELQELVLSKVTFYVNPNWDLLERPIDDLGQYYNLSLHRPVHSKPRTCHVERKYQHCNGCVTSPGCARFVEWKKATGENWHGKFITFEMPVGDLLWVYRQKQEIF